MNPNSAPGGQLYVSNTPVAVSADDPVLVRDQLGFAMDNAAIGEDYILSCCGEHGTPNVNAKEAWAAGDNLYWHIVRGEITKEETHVPIGSAARDKVANTAYGYVCLDNPHQKHDMAIYVVRVSTMDEQKVQGTYTFATFSPYRYVSECEIISDSLAPGTTTISIGDGSAGNDQVLASTAVSELSGYDVADGFNDPDKLPAAVGQLTLTIGTADLSAGFLVIRCHLTPAA